MNGLLTSVLLTAQEGGHAEEPDGLKLILPETAELVWGIICFVVVATLLMKVAFPKIREAVEKREKEIQTKLEEAENVRLEAQREREQYEKQIADARAEANRIIEEARQSAEQVRSDLIAKAEKEAQQVVQRATDQLENERQRTVQQLEAQLAAWSIELAERVVGKSLDGPTQRELVEGYIKDLSGMSNGGGRN